MRHLIVCPELPPAPSGGIGTYVEHIAEILAGAGETVHLVGRLCAGAGQAVEERYGGRLVIHRLPGEDRGEDLAGQRFARQAARLAERLVEQEGIDLVEAQEYEAPLWFFQLRRSLGLGPRRQPPCLVHLHSPTEFIARHNDWEPDRPGVAAACRREEESIRAADALLCPSRFLARQAEERYGLAAGSVHVIPLPLGGGAPVERGLEVWERGTICYVGRLERRKGVVEWIDAAVATAAAHPEVVFEFIGANVLGTPEVSGEGLVERRIPLPLRDRFVFRGARARAALPGLLAGARIAAVPSRWENFPNTCVEAMISGLPVIATGQGGMAEMITDGRTGWLAGRAAPDELAAALERALATPPAELRAMGRQAAADVARLCANEHVLRDHLAVRSTVAAQDAGRSLAPWNGDEAALRRLARSPISPPRAPALPRPLRKLLRSPRLAAEDAWKALGRLARRSP